MTSGLIVFDRNIIKTCNLHQKICYSQDFRKTCFHELFLCYFVDDRIFVCAKMFGHAGILGKLMTCWRLLVIHGLQGMALFNRISISKLNFKIFNDKRCYEFHLCIGSMMIKLPGFNITMKDHRNGDIFGHSLKLCSNMSPSQWFYLVISNPELLSRHCDGYMFQSLHHNDVHSMVCYQHSKPNDGD